MQLSRMKSASLDSNTSPVLKVVIGSGAIASTLVRVRICGNAMGEDIPDNRSHALTHSGQHILPDRRLALPGCAQPSHSEFNTACCTSLPHLPEGQLVLGYRPCYSEATA